MSYLYSPSTGGFYAQGISRKVPGDAVKVSKVEHGRLMAAQASGASIRACPKTGRPLAHGTAPSRAALAIAIRREAARRIEAVSPLWRQLNDMRQPGADAVRRFAAIDAIRDASGAIEEHLAAIPDDALDEFTPATHPLWPEIG